MSETKDQTEAACGGSALTAELDPRFLVCPQLVDLDYGPEPSMYTILCAYYTANGITPEKARKLTVQYSQEWARLVSNASNERPASAGPLD